MQWGCMPDLTPQSLMDGARRVQLRKLNQPCVPARSIPRKVLHMLKGHFHRDTQAHLVPHKSANEPQEMFPQASPCGSAEETALISPKKQNKNTLVEFIFQYNEHMGTLFSCLLH